MLLFIFGPDTFRAQQKIKEIKKKYHSELDKLSTSVSEYDGRLLKKEDLSRLMTTDSLFATKRLVQINDIFLHKQSDFYNALIDFLEKVDTESIIIFYDSGLMLDSSKKPCFPVDSKKTKAVSKDQLKLWTLLSRSYSQYFPVLTVSETITWIVKKVQTDNLSIDKNASTMLASQVNGDLWLLNNELDKLIAYKLAVADGKPISLLDLDLLTNQELGRSIFELTDAISNRDKSKAVDILNNQINQSMPDLFLLTMLVRQFRILIGVRQGLDNGLSPRQIGEQLRLNSFVLNKSINQARNFNLQSLSSIMSTLAKIDYRFKTGNLKMETMIDILIARL